MRPIDKGNIPLENGRPKTVSNYRNWRRNLIDRIGYYCSYCNIPLKDSPQVEHIIAQNLGGDITDWANLLLACGACNRSKSDRPCPPDTHFLPDVHNTHLAFGILETKNGGESAVFVNIRNELSPDLLRNKAQATIDLCNLDKDTTKVPGQVTDLRWKYRYETHCIIQIWRRNWNDWGRTKQIRFIELLITAAKEAGFWSIWFDAFIDVREIRQALIESFPGTDISSFDEDFIPIPKNTPD